MFRLEKLEIHGFKSFADKTTLVFGDGITGIVGPNGCGKCVTGDTLVTLADGREARIDELVEAALDRATAIELLDDGAVIHDNPQAIEILSLNLETLRLEPRRVKAFVKRKTTPQLLRVRTRAGRTVTATPYHPLFVLEDGRVRSIKAEEVKTGLRIATPRRLPVSPQPSALAVNEKQFVFGNRKPLTFPVAFTPELARFLGLLIAEGRNTSANQVWFVNADRAIVDEYERLAAELFALPVSRNHYKPQAEDALIYSKALCEALEKLFRFPVDSTSAEKQLPPQLLAADARTQWAFLSGLFEGDAYVSGLAHAGSPRPPYIEYVSASETLARQVVSLLLRLGVFALLRPKEKYASNTAEKRRKTYYSVYIYGTEQLRLAADKLSFVGDKKAALAALRQLPPAANPNHDLIPGITPFVKEAAKLAGVKLKPHRRQHPKLAAYMENRCEASRGGLLEVTEQIQRLGATPQRADDLLKGFATLATSDVYWDEIVSIEKVAPAEDWVYDLSIDETHNFVAGNILVHNSNVSEAISWVLGEQSAKSLRGGKMEDVIFNGTRDRKPTGMAEVILTMVATQDVASRGGDDARDEEEEYLEALDNAERAAATAKALVASEATGQETANAAGESQKAGDSGSKPAIINQDAAGEVKQEAQTEGAESDLTSDDKATTGAAIGESAKQTDAAATEATPTDAHSSVLSSQSSASQTPDAEVAEKKKAAKRKKKTIAVMAGERITIGRRLYRSGDSDYLMNGRPCLLRDIQDLFAGTGLGGAHYAIIEQGRIGQILSSKPLDRRALIEEAAGITKFKSRKRTTELRLESARQNLLRLNDIVTEVERQVNSLKRQAQRARRYKRLRDEMRALQKAVFTADYYRLQETAERVSRELEAARSVEGEREAALVELEGEYRVVAGESRLAEDRLTELREQAAAIDLEADRARNRRAFEERQLQELAARVEELRRDQQELERRLEFIETDNEERAGKLKTLETEVSAAHLELRAEEEHYQQELAQLRAAEAAIEQLRQQLLGEIGATERLKNLQANFNDSLRRTELRQNNLQAERERALTRRDEAADECARLAEEVEGGRARLAQLSEIIAERVEILDSLRRKSREYTQELEGVRVERAAAVHRLNSLEDLDAHHAYYSDTVQQILSPEQAAKIHALGTLADFVEVEPQYEKLVESLFARELQCVMVPTIDDALTGVEFIKTAGLGRGAFLVVGLHGGEDDSSESPESGVWSLESGDDDNSNGDKGHLSGNNNGNHNGNNSGNGGEPKGVQQQPAEAAEPQPEANEAAADAAPDEAANDAFASTTDADSEDEPRTPNSEVGTFDAATADSEVSGIGFELEVLNALQLLGLRPAIKAVVERAFPDKCAALVVPDMEAALELSIENPTRVYVTTEGEQVVNGRLIMTGGQEGQKGTSLLALKREIKQLRVQTEILRQEEERVSEDLQATRERLEEIEGETSRLDQELRQNEKSAAAKGSQLEALARDLERAEQHVRVVEGEIELAAEERQQLEARIEALAVEVRAAEASRDAAQQAVSGAQAALAERRADVERLAEALSSARAEAAARSERLQATRAEMRRIENEANELRSRLNRNRVESYESQTRIEELTASQSAVESATRRFDEERGALAEEIAAAAAALSTARARSDELEQTVGETRRQSAAARDRRNHLEVEQARLEAEAEHLTRTCFAELALSIQEVVAQHEQGTGQEAAEPGAEAQQEPAGAEAQQADAAASEAQFSVLSPQSCASPTPDPRPLSPFDVEAARARLDELRVKLDDIGPVNMMALEELEEAEERFTFLSEQRRDILDSIKLTEEALAEIKRRSRERFRHAFAHINENFQKMFVELFGGGRGEMILLDEDDVLESGIDIIAQPPGKRLQSVLLLSGGEKAMSAISLVLAIFQYKPSPFCILDEVDAPLDEMNVGRFAGKVAEMSNDTQFLVITHNKRTMEAARALYGVTMEEPGISKLVSVKFE